MAHAENSLTCRQWLGKLAQKPNAVQAKQAITGRGSTAAIAGPSSDPWDIASLTEADKLKAIRCLYGQVFCICDLIYEHVLRKI